MMRPFLFVVVLTAFCALGAWAQEPVLDFNNDDFHDSFSVAVVAYEYDNYFVADMSVFSSRLERIYFLNLIFKEKMVVNIDPDIEKRQLWFKSPVDNTEEEVVCLMNELKDQAISDVLAMDEEEQTNWLRHHDKYVKSDNLDR